LLPLIFDDKPAAMIELATMTWTESLTTIAYAIGLVGVLLLIWSLLNQSVSVLGLGLLIGASILMLIVQLVF